MSTNDTLLSPINVGGLELINRVVMAPMTRNQSPENIPTDANVEYYRKRAAGGVGLIVTEGTCVDHIAASGYPGVPYIHGDDRLAGWKRVVEAVHAEGGKIAPQLWHVGGMRKKGVLPEGDVDGYAPSGMNVPGKVNRHVMSAADIDDVIGAFAKGARDSKAVGFDAVEIHGAHGYLLDQFFWEGTNSVMTLTVAQWRIAVNLLLKSSLLVALKWVLTFRSSFVGLSGSSRTTRRGWQQQKLP